MPSALEAWLGPANEPRFYLAINRAYFLVTSSKYCTFNRELVISCATLRAGAAFSGRHGLAVVVRAEALERWDWRQLSQKGRGGVTHEPRPQTKSGRSRARSPRTEGGSCASAAKNSSPGGTAASSACAWRRRSTRPCWGRVTSISWGRVSDRRVAASCLRLDQAPSLLVAADLCLD